MTSNKVFVPASPAPLNPALIPTRSFSKWRIFNLGSLKCWAQLKPRQDEHPIPSRVRSNKCWTYPWSFPRMIKSHSHCKMKNTATYVKGAFTAFAKNSYLVTRSHMILLSCDSRSVVGKPMSTYFSSISECFQMRFLCIISFVEISQYNVFRKTPIFGFGIAWFWLR